MVSPRKAINRSVVALSAIASCPALATNLTFNNSRSDGQSYVGFYDTVDDDPGDPLSTYGSNVDFGSATTGSTQVYQNFINTYTFNYQIGNGWTPNVSMSYGHYGIQSVGQYFTGPGSEWPNGAVLLGGNFPNNPNDDFTYTFTPAPGYAVRINSYELVNASFGAISTAGTIYENTLSGPTLAPTFVPANVQSGAGDSVNVDLQNNYGSTFYTGTLILDIHQTNGNPGDLGLTNLNFDQELVAGSGQWGLFFSGDWNVANNWGGGVVPNGIDASATLGSAITSAATVYSNSAVTVGSLTFNNANKYVVAGAGSLTLQTSSGNATVNVSQGTQEINLPTTLASNTVFNVSTGATLVVGDPLTVSSGHTLTTTGAGVVNYDSNITVQSSASIAFSNSTHAHLLSLASGSTASVGGTGTVLELDSLSNGGTIDLENNALIINYGSGADPIATIKAEIASGYAGGAWNGVGINSSIAHTTSGSFGLGYADSADPGNPAGLASGTIEVVYTLLGDANLDGAVNGSDFAILATNFNKAVSGWDQGDFNYDGAANGADFASLAANFNKGTTIALADVAALNSFAEANGLLTSVPEPTSVGLLTLGAIGMFARRRRHNSACTR